jgi:hypothetical protein
MLLLAAALPTARVLAQDEAPRPRLKISAAQLYEALSSHFPVRFGMPGVLEVQVSAPRLELLPARNKLGAGLRADWSDARGQPLPAGDLDLVFALRYEPADQTLRGHDPEIVDLRWPGMPPQTRETVRALLPALTRNLGEILLHRFTRRELQLADTMGFQPQEFLVQDDGLLILFGPKPPRP